jgi:hypothetical protein
MFVEMRCEFRAATRLSLASEPEASEELHTYKADVLTKITLAFALAIAAISAVPASVGHSFAQSTPTLDCSYSYWGTSTC